MAEEFIEDIIASSENKAPDTTEDPAAPDVTPDANDQSASTTEPESRTNDDTASEQNDTDTAPTVSAEVEELASQLGWNKDHKGADPVDAATYILRSRDIQNTLKDHNKDLKNQLNGLQGSVEALKEHNIRVYQADVKRLKSELATLKAEKKAAVELADVAKVEELDQQIEDVQKDIDKPIEDAPSANPLFDEWVADNNWYLTDNDMANYADIVADQYAGAPPERIYALVRQKVAEVFPEKFTADTPEAATTTTTTPPELDASAPDKVVGPQSPVEGASRTPDGANFTKADLSADQTAIMNQFVKSGIMTEEQYIADIAKMQGE